MHYKNGRLAREGDPVICRGYNGKITVGKIHSLVAGSDSCNCQVSEIIPGGVQQLTCQTVGTMYHAEDGYELLEKQAVEKAAEALKAPPVDNAHVAEGAEKFATPATEATEATEVTKETAP